MAAPAKQSWLHNNVLRLSRWHFLYVIAFAIQTVIYDAWNLVAPNAALNRWIMTGLLLIVTTTVWYLAHNTVKTTAAYKSLVFALIVTDIAAASFNVYTQRGMASRAVMLYAVPIVISAVLLSRAAIFASACLSAAAYIGTAYAYFVLNFNEGYKIELYGEVGFYSVIFFFLAGLLWIVIRSRRAKPPA
jgi:hypothetical protein